MTQCNLRACGQTRVQVADLQNDTQFLAILACWIGTIFEIRKSHAHSVRIPFITLSSISISKFLLTMQIKEKPPRMRSAAACIAGDENGAAFRN
jgi:hypothetical protein